MDATTTAAGARSMSTKQAAVLLQPHGRGGRISPQLARRVKRVGAWSRLEFELRSIATDLLGPFDSEDLPPDLTAWVETATETAVPAVCDTSLRALIAALDSLLAGAPSEVTRRLEETGARHDAGIF